MADSPSWYSKGSSGIEADKKKKETESKPKRLWIKPGTSVDTIFLDDDSFNVYEYNWSAEGHFRNWATYTDGDPEAVAPFKEKGLKPYFVAFRTVIDCSEYKDSQGRIRKFELALLPAKGDTAQLIERRKASRDGKLIGTMFHATRNEGQKTSSCGDDFEFRREVPLADVYKVAQYKGVLFADLIKQANEDPGKLELLKSKFQLEIVDGVAQPKLVPFNYFSVLKPPTAREAKLLMAGALARNAQQRGSGNAGGGASGEDDLPF